MPPEEALAEEGWAQLVEELGLLFEECGNQRMMGRTLAQLMLGGKPHQSQAELARALNASVASVSIAVRQLVQLGLVNRVRVPRAQREYYALAPDAWRHAFDRAALMRRLREFAERGLELAPVDDKASRGHLESMRDYYLFWEQEYPALLERFKAERGTSAGASTRSRRLRESSKGRRT